MSGSPSIDPATREPAGFDISRFRERTTPRGVRGPCAYVRHTRGGHLRRGRPAGPMISPRRVKSTAGKPGFRRGARRSHEGSSSGQELADMRKAKVGRAGRGASVRGERGASARSVGVRNGRPDIPRGAYPPFSRCRARTPRGGDSRGGLADRSRPASRLLVVNVLGGRFRRRTYMLLALNAKSISSTEDSRR